MPGRPSRATANAGASAPDLFEPVFGWRTWLVVTTAGGLRLRSVVFAKDWTPRDEFPARCEFALHRRWYRPWRRVSAHGAPSTGCECGVWAAKDIEFAATFLNLYDDLLGDACVHRVIGRVALWGTVVDGGLGWRASRAYPAEIYVPTRREDGQPVEAHTIARGLACYGVPVRTVDLGVGAESGSVVPRIRDVSGESVGEASIT